MAVVPGSDRSAVRPAAVAVPQAARPGRGAVPPACGQRPVRRWHRPWRRHRRPGAVRRRARLPRREGAGGGRFRTGHRRDLRGPLGGPRPGPGRAGLGRVRRDGSPRAARGRPRSRRPGSPTTSAPPSPPAAWTSSAPSTASTTATWTCCRRRTPPERAAALARVAAPVSARGHGEVSVLQAGLHRTGPRARRRVRHDPVPHAVLVRQRGHDRALGGRRSVGDD